MPSIAEVHREVKQLVKRRCPTVHVTKGTGTAAEWTDVSGSRDRVGRFTEAEAKCLSSIDREVFGSERSILNTNSIPLSDEIKMRLLRGEKQRRYGDVL